MTVSRTEAIYLIAGLRLIQEGNFKPSDKKEVGPLIEKIKLEVQSNERSNHGKIITRMGGFHLEPTIRMQG